MSVIFGAICIAAPVQAATIDEILARMDEIIVEMQSLRTEFDGLSGQAAAVEDSTPVTGQVLGASNRLTETIAFGETN
ncbi:MAG: hypothetical protein AAFO91_17695, partial [Bacteroidota bacterium]